MKIRYDKSADAVYIEFQDEKFASKRRPPESLLEVNGKNILTVS